MRDVFGTRPQARAETIRRSSWRCRTSRAASARARSTCHIAQFLALKGYRVASIDCDSQA